MRLKSYGLKLILNSFYAVMLKIAGINFGATTVILLILLNLGCAFYTDEEYIKKLLQKRT